MRQLSLRDHWAESRPEETCSDSSFDDVDEAVLGKNRNNLSEPLHVLDSLAKFSASGIHPIIFIGPHFIGPYSIGLSPIYFLFGREEKTEINLPLVDIRPEVHGLQFIADLELAFLSAARKTSGLR